jgi:apolipoprotein N-acyltransferase
LAKHRWFYTIFGDKWEAPERSILMTDTSNQTFSLALGWRAALAVAAGLLLTAGYALHPLWWAPWLAPIPLTVAAAAGPGRAWLMGAIAGAAAVISVLGYYFGMSGAGVGVFLIVVLRIASWGAAARWVNWANRRLPMSVAMLALPVFVAAVETVSMMVSVHGTAGSLAYSQMDLPGVIQVASIGGVPMIGFVVLLPGSFLGVWLTRKRKADEIAVAAGILGAVALATGLYANDRLSAPQSAPRVHATLMVTDRFNGIPTDWAKVWNVYGPQVAVSARAGGVTVLPEKIALLDPAQTAGAVGDIGAMAQKTRATLVVGLEVHDGKAYYNRAVVAAPDGGVAWYTKQRLVPGFEDRDVPGRAPLFVKVAHAPVGVAICKDMHIPSIGREYAGTAGLMAVPAWDFGQDGWMGARMTMLRGVESGYAVARSARDGFAGAYDAEGRVIAEAPSSPGMTVVDADLPAQSLPTFYGRFGNLFGFASLAALVLTIGGLVLKKKPAERAQQGGGFDAVPASKG